MQRERSRLSYGEWLDILKEFYFQCFWCGEPVTFKTALKDHLEPICRGGEDVWTNVVPACPDCNSKRGNLMPHEFLAKLGRTEAACAKKRTGLVFTSPKKEIRDENEATSWAWKNPP